MADIFNQHFTPLFFLFLNQASPQAEQDLHTAHFAS